MLLKPKEVEDDRRELPGIPFDQTRTNAPDSSSECRYKLPGTKLDFLRAQLYRRLVSSLGESDSHTESRVFPDERWERLFSYLTEEKFIKNFYIEKNYTDVPDVHMLRVTSGDFSKKITDGFTPVHESFSRGVSTSYTEALSKVIGEQLERFSLGLYKEDELIRASAAELLRRNQKYLDPKLVTHFSEEQKKEFPLLRYSDEATLRWQYARSLTDGSRLLVPAQLVYWNYSIHHTDYVEPLLKEGNTNGAGGFFTLEGALLSGLYEIIQRDAFLIHWLNRKAPSVVNIVAIEDEETQFLLKESQRLNFEIKVLDTTIDTEVPSCVCVLFDHSGVGPWVTLGGGCGFEPVSTIKRAVTEAFGVYHTLRTNKEETSLPENYRPFLDNSIKFERLKLYDNLELFKQIQFFFEGTEIPLDKYLERGKLFDSEKEEMEEVVRRIVSLGGVECTPLYFQAKNAVLDTVGFHSVRVIVPAFIPLYLLETRAPISAPRIREVARKYDWPKVEIQTLPHLFP